MKLKLFYFLSFLILLGFILASSSQNGVNSASLHGWNGTGIKEIWLDKTTRTLPTIDYEHYAVHLGSSFSVSEYATVGAAATREYILVTPSSTAWAHLVWEIQGTLVTTIAFYEDATTSDNGTAITSINRNRNSIAVSGVSIYHTPTLTGDGNLIYTEKFGVTSGNQIRIGGKSRAAQEIVLKQNTKYLLRITSGTAGNVISTNARWYDLVNKG